MQIKKICVAIVVLMTIVTIQPVFALSDGAYLIGRSTSYVNPLTGNTEDGGTNITLGDSMVSSIVEGQLLLEKTNGKMYLTIGLGLASNVSNIRIKTMTSSGSLSNAKSTVTGSSQANGDTVKHYRIQIQSLDDYISPIMYVTPMGRDVQFFIKLNQETITVGTGIYNSQMITVISQNNEKSSTNNASSQQKSQKTEKKEEQETTSSQKKTETTQKVEVGEVSRESLFKDVSGLSTYVVDTNGEVNQKESVTVQELLSDNNSKDNPTQSMALMIGILFMIVVILLGGFYYVKKIKK